MFRIIKYDGKFIKENSCSFHKANAMFLDIASILILIPLK